MADDIRNIWKVIFILGIVVGSLWLQVVIMPSLIETYVVPTPTPTATVEPTPTEQLVDIVELVDMGKFRYTYYTDSIADTGKTDGITYSGAKAVDGITIAADLSVLPLGSWVYIESVGVRKVEDIGGAVKGKLIDIYIDVKRNDLVTSGRVYLIKGR